MNDINLQVGPSSWDRDMRDIEADPEESENLTALGMHITGVAASDDEEEEEEEKTKEGEEGAEAVKEEPEELDALKELERLAEELKKEDEPVLVVDEEE